MTAAQSPTNIASWLEKPAGKDGFVTVKDGHLHAGGKRLRIFGVNMAFGGNFPTKEDAPKVAARMAKFGINCVRFHHMDMQTARRRGSSRRTCARSTRSSSTSSTSSSPS